MNWIKRFFNKEHKHFFKIEDVINAKIDPKCRCEVALSECK